MVSDLGWRAGIELQGLKPMICGHKKATKQMRRHESHLHKIGTIVKDVERGVSASHTKSQATRKISATNGLLL